VRASPEPSEAPQPRPDVLGLAFDEREPHGGVGGAKARDRQRHQRRAGSREGGHPQQAAAHAEDRLDLRLGRLDPREDAVGVGDQRGTGGGRTNAAPVAVQQDRAGLSLERRDGLRDRRLRVGERVGRGRERAPPGDFPEHPEAGHVQHRHR
jgi:hypothetical protein